MKEESLFLFTDAYPYGNSETPFLKKEVEELSRIFKKIYIFPLNNVGPKENTPSNVEIVDLFEGYNYSKPSFTFKNLSILIKHLIANITKYKRISDIIYVISYYLRCYDKSILLQNKLVDISDEKKIFYCYWFDEWAVILSILKPGYLHARYISRAHGFDLFEERNKLGFIPLKTLQLKSFDKVISASQKGLNYLRNKYPAYENKFFYNYLGVPDQGLNLRSNADFEFILVSCSRIEPVKRVHLIADILKHVNINLKWLHIGNGSQLNELNEHLRSLPDNITVELKGELTNEQVIDFYKNEQVDLFINVSESEGIPVSLMEALSFGIPLMGTDVGGNPEIVNDRTGFLIPQYFDSRNVAGIINNFNQYEFSNLNKRREIKDFWSENFNSQKNIKRFTEYLLNNVEYNQCSRCILDTNDDSHIQFDEKNICNYCRKYEYIQTVELGSPEERKNKLAAKIEEIKSHGKGKNYDCLLGISGGVDSSFLAYWAFENGLRPLVIHLDNGWNSELAVQNIQSICQKLNYDLHTHVIDWEEFKELQLAYLKASVVDIEVLTDHAITAVTYDIAKKYHIKYTLSGYNYATEAIMPKGWTFDKTDYTNIIDIYKKYGCRKTLKTFPKLTFAKKLYYHFFLKIESVQVLNYINYNKATAKKILTEKLGWKDYGGKHFESVFTKFYQIYILPNKFKIDKRKAHLSNLICSGQITKEEAMEELKKQIYDGIKIQNEKEYVIKKLGLTTKEFEEVMNLPVRKHQNFDSDQKYWKVYFKFVKLLKSFKF